LSSATFSGNISPVFYERDIRAGLGGGGAAISSEVDDELI
jgi:hypothetical protein